MSPTSALNFVAKNFNQSEELIMHTMTKDVDVSQQILFINDVEKIIGRNRLTIRRWWLDGKFPAPIKLNGTNLAWHVATIHQWIHQHIK